MEGVHKQKADAAENHYRERFSKASVFETKLMMETHYTIALDGSIAGRAMPADYPVNFTGGPVHAVPYFSVSAAYTFGLSLRCSTSLRTAMLRHHGGHISRFPQPFTFANIPVRYRLNHNVAHQAAYTIFFNK